MILEPSLKLEAVLAGAVSANEPEAHVWFRDWNTQGTPTPPAPFRTALNSSTDVTILAAPVVSGTVREVERVSIYNKDTASVTVTVKTDDGTTERIVCKVTLATLETLHFEKDRGWYVTTTAGSIKSSGGIAGIGSSTDNAVARWDGTGGSSLQNSAFVVDDNGQVTSFGGNITFPASQSASAGANTLDDYEEGTWTPADGSGAGLSFTLNGTPWYTKVGRNVIYGASITYPSTANGSNSLISGLPFTVANNISCQVGALAYTTESTCAHCPPIANTANLQPFTAAGAAIANSTLSTDSINVGGSYIV